MTTPPGKIIKFHETIVLRGEGMPIYRRPEEKGDLYVVFQIEMPDEQWLKTADVQVSTPYLRSPNYDVAHNRP